jgi:hypothetical protein
MRSTAVKHGYVGAYLFDKERGVIIGNDKKLNIVIIDRNKHIVFRTAMTEEDAGVIHSMAENSYFSRLAILEKVYSIFGIDGSLTILGRKTKKVLLRTTAKELSFMSFANVMNIHGLKILL